MTEYKSLPELDDSTVKRYLCYPRFDEETFRDRVSQLEELGVEAVSLGGPHGVLGYPILGKGHVGVVLKARWKNRDVALKARRTDADRPSMTREAELLALANSVDCGPKVYSSSRDFVVMERIVGPYFGDWVDGFTGKEEKIRGVIGRLLWKTRRLDAAGLDHGELNRMRRHFIVTRDGARIIDFESASTGRRTQNVTATVQSIFMSVRFGRRLSPHMRMPDREPLILALTAYKRLQTDGNFVRILEVLGLH